jgi:ABC-2 type transport system ATP-binding protein
MSDIPLKVENVYKSFGKKKVLDDVSLEIKAGESFGLIGLNGAGKTTMIKIILGLLDQDNGAVKLFGGDASRPETRKKLSFLPEKFHPSHLLKGREFLSLTLSYYGMKYDHNKACEMVEKLDLDPNVLGLKITKYSKGMGQKLGLASAFLVNAPLLMLDEPMSGLDPSARIKLKETLQDYVKQGNTVFFSSHILSDIDEICGRITILHNSKIQFTGSPQEFKNNMKSEHLERAFLNLIAA